MEAARYGYALLVRVLLDAGADANVQNEVSMKLMNQQHIFCV
jgi:ankyrin repeat protein